MKMLIRLLVLVCVGVFAYSHALSAGPEPLYLKQVEVVGTLKSFILNKVEPTGISDWDSLVFSIDSPERLKGKAFSVLAYYYPRPRSAERRREAEIYWTQKIGMRTKLTMTEALLFRPEEAARCVMCCSNWWLRFTAPNEPLEPSAEYPAELRAAGKEGMAVVEFIVTTEGSVAEAKVVEADHPLFGEAAIQAIRRWKFPQPMSGDRKMHNGGREIIYFMIEKEPGKNQSQPTDGSSNH